MSCPRWVLPKRCRAETSAQSRGRSRKCDRTRRGKGNLSYLPLRRGAGEPLSLERVQGGAFSPRNHLYLACDTKDGGLLGFDVTTGRCHMHVVIPFEPNWPEQQVIEGLTVVDLDDGPVPWMSGQVHVLVFDAEENRDDYVWLRHFAARTATDRHSV
jgi:hypothetical protein